jgi:hypothetical protein
MSELRLAICLPLVNEMVYKRFFVSWATLIKPGPYELIIPRFNPGEIPESLSYIRNMLVERALDLGATHIAMMDTDQWYPHDTLIKLLSHDVDIVGAKIHRRYPPFDPCMMRGTRGRMRRVPEEEWKNNPLIEVDATGAGCVLHKAEVFKKIQMPWYKILLGGKTRAFVGEDIAFCLKARAAGFRIFIDTTINVGHTSLIDVDESFYEVAKRASMTQEEAFDFFSKMKMED